MAEAISINLGCSSSTSGKITDTSPLNRMAVLQRAPDSLSFHKSVSSRLALSLSRSCFHTRQASMQVNAVALYPTSMAWWKKGNQPNMHDINSAQQFVDAITKARDKLVLVDFYSVSCRSCKALHPKICQIAADNPDIEVLKVNFYENTALCRSLNVSMLPFFHFYRGDEGRIDAFSCSLTKINKLRAAVGRHKNGRSALSAPGPVAPVANRKVLMPMPTHAMATAASVS